MKNKRTEGKIKSHYGMRDYFNYFKKNNPNLNINRTLYSKIISDINFEITNLIIEDNLTYVLPYLGSSLSIRKTKNIPKIKNNKLYNTSPVDWKTTNELWESDKEAKENKILVRYLNEHTSRHVFRIYFKKYILYFKNKQYYSFKPCRDFSRMLAKRIKDENKDKYDSYLLY